MSQNEAKPIFSSCEDDCDKGEEIDRFVIGLAEQVDELQDAELEGDLVLLGRRAGELARKASELGYAPMFEIAQVVAYETNTETTGVDVSRRHVVLELNLEPSACSGFLRQAQASDSDASKTFWRHGRG